MGELSTKVRHFHHNFFSLQCQSPYPFPPFIFPFICLPIAILHAFLIDSLQAQGLKRVITSYQKMLDHEEEQIIYIMWKRSQDKE